MDAFLAFLDHVHGLLTTTYHNTPIMLMASPQWTRPDCETIARYIFENTRTPALCIIHSGIATQYGLKWPHMTVIDIGHEKVDVTAIYDGRVANHTEVSVAGYGNQVSGGEVFTQSLLKLLKEKGFNRDMAEQLKKSNICEVLPYIPTAETLMELPVASASEAAALSAAADAAATAPAEAIPRINVLEEGENTNGSGEDDGVLDVATIVTSGQTKEFLAKKEKEKEKEKGKGRKKGDKEADAAANKPVRLPNSKRMKNTFFYEDIVLEEVPKPTESATNGAAGGEKKEGEANGAAPDVAAQSAPAITDAPAVSATTNPNEPPEKRPKRVRKDIEVGLERFKFAERTEIDRIVTAIYRCIQEIGDMYMRPPCWDNLVFVGNGSRLRGLKENILQTLNARHLISPSTATMFTSELPSNMATPTGTGAQTPVGSFSGAPHQLSTSGVNPLLQAATTASATAGGTNTVATPAAGSEAGGPVSGTHFHSQTPTSIKTANLPAYLSEWSKNGFEEAMFLGAQVAARIAFCLHTNMDASGLEAQRLMSLSRVDYKYVFLPFLLKMYND
jgi:actin-related protein 9